MLKAAEIFIFMHSKSGLFTAKTATAQNSWRLAIHSSHHAIRIIWWMKAAFTNKQKHQEKDKR